MGHVIEGARKDGSYGAGTGSDVQGGGTFGVIIWKRELGGDRRDAQVPGGVPPSGGVTDHGDDRETRGRRIVGVNIVRGGDGICGAPLHRGVHEEVADKHSDEDGLPPYLCTLHRGGADAGDDLLVHWWDQDVVNETDE